MTDIDGLVDPDACKKDSFAFSPLHGSTVSSSLMMKHTPEDLFKDFLSALNAHQTHLQACASFERKAYEALRLLDLTSLSSLCRTKLFFTTEASQAQGAAGLLDLHGPASAMPATMGDSTTASSMAPSSVQFHGSPIPRSAEAGDSTTASSIAPSSVHFHPSPIPRAAEAGNSAAGHQKLSNDAHSEAHERDLEARGQDTHTDLDLAADLHFRFSSEDPGPVRSFSDLGGLVWTRPIRRCLLSREFEMICAAFMFMNVVVMLLQLELSGWKAGEKLGEYRDSGVSQASLDILDKVEFGFTGWFTIELLMRYWASGWNIFTDPLTVFDAVVVMGTLVDVVLNHIFQAEEFMNLSIARMIRVLKVLKFFRTFRAASTFTELRILLRTVLRSTIALLWTMVVLSMIILACSNFTAQLLRNVVLDESKDYDLRVWVYRHYGTAARSAYTMLEATLSGGWPNYADPLVRDVSPLWGIFWMLYVFVVIFATIRVMSALFLAASLKAAAEDDEMQSLRRRKDAKSWTAKLQQIFIQELDRPDVKPDNSSSVWSVHTSKSSRAIVSMSLTRKDLDKVLSVHESAAKLHGYGFDALELKTLFNILADRNDRVSLEAFLNWALRLKAGVKAIDVIEILKEVEAIRKEVHHMANRSFLFGSDGFG